MAAGVSVLRPFSAALNFDSIDLTNPEKHSVESAINGGTLQPYPASLKRFMAFPPTAFTSVEPRGFLNVTILFKTGLHI
ncbi:MAG: hypothetical protein BWY32_02531 [bacterium ADurb.Bin243]|nr:MAG: hypothetical protein BWY32_02531 [bacterium ADurb.Bin243]